MIPCFAKAWEEWFSVGHDGAMSPPIAVQLTGPFTWCADPDGVIVSCITPAPSGDECMLTILYPMPAWAAEARMRQRRFPARLANGSMVTLLKKHSEVVGNSGEQYSRFIADSRVVSSREDA